MCRWWCTTDGVARERRGIGGDSQWLAARHNDGRTLALTPVERVVRSSDRSILFRLLCRRRWYYRRARKSGFSRCKSRELADLRRSFRLSFTRFLECSFFFLMCFVHNLLDGLCWATFSERRRDGNDNPIVWHESSIKHRYLIEDLSASIKHVSHFVVLIERRFSFSRVLKSSWCCAPWSVRIIRLVCAEFCADAMGGHVTETALVLFCVNLRCFQSRNLLPLKLTHKIIKTERYSWKQIQFFS